MQPIADWLTKLGLGQYAERFADNDIDVPVLRHFTDQNFEKIGVSLGHRRKMLGAVARHQPPALLRAAEGSPWAHSNPVDHSVEARSTGRGTGRGFRASLDGVMSDRRGTESDPSRRSCQGSARPILIVPQRRVKRPAMTEPAPGTLPRQSAD